MASAMMAFRRIENLIELVRMCRESGSAQALAARIIQQARSLQILTVDLLALPLRMISADGSNRPTNFLRCAFAVEDECPRLFHHFIT